MALRDLFRACPECGSAAGLQQAGRAERCAACLTSFRRARGATIRATLRDGAVREGSPLEWLDRLPQTPPAQNGGLGPQRARLRLAEGKQQLRRNGELLGWIERFGPARQGAIHLSHDTLTFADGDGSTVCWNLDELTAIQPSSTSLQLKARGRPVAAVRFLEGSLRCWEECIQEALRNRYRQLGRGEILEFQPRIVCR